MALATLDAGPRTQRRRRGAPARVISTASTGRARTTARLGTLADRGGEGLSAPRGVLCGAWRCVRVMAPPDGGPSERADGHSLLVLMASLRAVGRAPYCRPCRRTPRKDPEASTTGPGTKRETEASTRGGARTDSVRRVWPHDGGSPIPGNESSNRRPCRLTPGRSVAPTARSSVIDPGSDRRSGRFFIVLGMGANDGSVGIERLQPHLVPHRDRSMAE